MKPHAKNFSRLNTLTRVGLVSDTHGKFDRNLPRILDGVEVILHAGDVGCLSILTQLNAIAPTIAVSGNVDTGVADLDFLPAVKQLEIACLRIFITHYVGKLPQLLPPVAMALQAASYDLVLSGHTHEPSIETHGNILFVNPGSCGPKRFDLPRTCGILEIDASEKIEAPKHTVVLYEMETCDVFME